MDDSKLLGELRIDRSTRDAKATASRMPWLVGVVLLLALTGAAAWWWSRNDAMVVRTVTAKVPAAGDSGAVLQATGYVTARRMATVSAQMLGTLTDVLIEEGDRVEKGQILARLEDGAHQAQLNSAKAGVNVAQARLAELRVQIAQAERDAARQAELGAQGLVPVQSAEQTRTQLDALRAQLHTGSAQAEQSRAQLASAQVNFEYTVVRAPFAGVVTAKAAQVGEIVSPSAAGGGYTRTGVCTIVDMDSLEVGVDVNEAYIGRVQANMPAEAVLDAYPDWSIPAHVIAIVPTADRGKATVKVRVGLDQKDPRIVPDMGVRVSFLEAERKEAAIVLEGVLVPASSIAQRDGRSVVFTVEDEHARSHAVNPAAQTFGDQRLIPDGIRAGARVIDAPPEALVDGAQVRLAKP
ncbi:MAG TPA: efflux RND transporter periplasmic adaptor subunit [Chiayiivirga sp.]|nr:efflux RND transporter periplasmic adaptor subunit [Chiayiivirga sp.]